MTLLFVGILIGGCAMIGIEINPRADGLWLAMAAISGACIGWALG